MMDENDDIDDKETNNEHSSVSEKVSSFSNPGHLHFRGEVLYCPVEDSGSRDLQHVIMETKSCCKRAKKPQNPCTLSAGQL